MHSLTIRQRILYGALLVLGATSAYLGFSNAWGGLFETMAHVVGVCFIGVALYGVLRRTPLQQLAWPVKAVLGVGVLTLALGVGLMAYVIYALRNFT